MVFYLVEGLTLAPFVASSDAFGTGHADEELVTLYYGKRGKLSAFARRSQKSTYSK